MRKQRAGHKHFHAYDSLGILRVVLFCYVLVQIRDGDFPPASHPGPGLVLSAALRTG